MFQQLGSRTHLLFLPLIFIYVELYQCKLKVFVYSSPCSRWHVCRQGSVLSSYLRSTESDSTWSKSCTHLLTSTCCASISSLTGVRGNTTPLRHNHLDLHLLWWWCLTWLSLPFWIHQWSAFHWAWLSILLACLSDCPFSGIWYKCSSLCPCLRTVGKQTCIFYVSVNRNVLFTMKEKNSV